MFRFILLCLGMLVRFFRVRQSLLLENLALRQQLAVLKRRRRSLCLSPFDKLFWVAVSRFWSGWKQALVVVTPATVIRWHRAGSLVLETDLWSRDAGGEEADAEGSSRVD